MEFRLAVAEDLPEIWRITLQAKAQLKGLGLDQWQNGYPSYEGWTDDIGRQAVWLAAENGTILGAFLFHPGDDPSYGVIEGKWLSSAPYAAIHRVCVSDDSKGKGVAGAMFQHGFAMARKLGFTSVRIDTHPGNLPMQRALGKAGFVRCGIIHLNDGGAEDGAPRIAFEYIL